MKSDVADTLMRVAAFGHVLKLSETQNNISAEELRRGFTFEGERIPLVNPQRGIFKPRQMQYLLSIRTVFPRPGKPVWYDDQRQVHRQIFESREAVDYAFMGKNPDAADNRWLREAFENRIPVIYFLGVAPGLYQAIIPTYISGWDANALKAQIVFGIQNQADYVAPESVNERCYALQTVKQRLHQASFREAVITAYNGRCALSGLPEQRLLDAAHIISDKDERLGQPVVPNGLPLSKIHHAAFDAHLIGIDPDYRLHVSGRLLDLHEGPMLEALKQLEGGVLHLPARTKDYPDRDRLALRYEQFKVAA
ncbi:MAG: HNH endonuclease [Gammaproteobacteria bacterium]|nr:HNH endonuclease [Gammaproteobacteria bacterium]